MNIKGNGRQSRPVIAPDPNRARPRAKDLVARYGVTRQAIGNWVKSGFLPPPIEIGPNVRAWILEEIEAVEGVELERRPALVRELVAARQRNAR
jgi:predicted DNA-binding transcriptional regulator AlpA